MDTKQGENIKLESDKTPDGIYINCNNNSKTDIKAENYNKTKVFDIQSHNLNIDLSRVDSENYPDTTENLDFIANKMGLNQNSTNPEPNCKVTEISLKEEIPTNACNTPDTVVDTSNSKKTAPEQLAPTEHHKKANLMTKILRRLSKPGIFSKDKKQKKVKDKTTISPDHAHPSLSSENKSNTVGENNNNFTPRSKSFRKVFSRFVKKKPKSNMLSEPVSSIGSRPSVSSAVITTVNVDCVGSCNDVFIDKICREELEKYNSSSVDCILDHRMGKLSKKHESVSSNSEDLREHELKMNTSNNHINSIFRQEIADNDNSECKDTAPIIDGDKLCPLNVALNVPSWNSDTDRSCHSAMSVHATDSSSNVKLTLSLHGYSSYGLSSSRLNSRSCMEFHSASMSPKSKVFPVSITNLSEKVASSGSDKLLNANETVIDTKVNCDEVDNGSTPNDAKLNGVSCGIEEKPSEESSVMLRKSERPNEIQLRRSKVTSQTSIARSSLIMVAVSQHTPRSKGHVTTPIYNLESPNFPGRKLEFNEEIVEEKTEKTTVEKDGNHFLQIANRYEESISGKIEIVQRYLETSKDQMSDDVIGELNTAVGLAKLLLSEKFVQFRGLCSQNINESQDNGFRTLACDLEGYLTTLEIQMADLDKNFQSVERIRANDWRMPVVVETPRRPSTASKKPRTPKVTPVDGKRAMEARKRLAEYRKMAAAAPGSVSASLFVVH